MLEVITIFSVCLISGVLTGLLGVGGGLIIIPMFLLVLPFAGINFTLPQIIGISATCVFLNSSVTTFYRRKEKFLPFKTILPSIIATIIGSSLGAYFSDFAPRKALLLIYMIVSIVSIFLMYKQIKFKINPHLKKYILPLLFVFFGMISASIGIGGAVFFAVILQCITDENPKELLPTVTLFVLANALFAFGGKLLLGHITPWIIPIAFVASLFGSKFGIRISQELSPKTLNKLMCLLLVLGLIKITYEFFN